MQTSVRHLPAPNQSVGTPKEFATWYLSPYVDCDVHYLVKPIEVQANHRSKQQQHRQELGTSLPFTPGTLVFMVEKRCSHYPSATR